MTISALLGLTLSLLLLSLVAGGALVSWKSPFRALGILVAGMAFHNFVLMVLIRLNTPAVLIRAVQAWKEILLAVLCLAAVAFARSHLRRLPRLLVPDWIAVAFTVIVIGYAILQLLSRGNGATLAQVLVSLRLALLMPLLYMFGRIFLPRGSEDLGFTRGAILAAAGVLGLFGLWELWFVPTRDWLQWGAVGFSKWLGFDYGGPQGLPANFFQTTSSGLLLRRMVSTYLSPLGVAYTGLLIVPYAFLHAIWPQSVPRWPRALRYLVLAVVVISVGLSVTRLALASIGAECLLIALILRRSLSTVLASAVIAVGLVAIFAYPSFGPVMNSSLHEVQSPTRFLREPSTLATQLPHQTSTTGSPTPSGIPSPSQSGAGGILAGNDPSIRAHIQAVLYGVRYVIEHPLGTGPGSAVPRYGTIQGPAESALLRIGGEFGLLGALLYAAMYGAAVIAAAALIRRRGWQRAIGLAALVGAVGLLPISLTSDVWGDFSVTFLFWWIAGLVVSLWRSPAAPAVPLVAPA